MKKVVFAAVLAFAAAASLVWSDPRTMIDIVPPSGLEAKQADLTILHRFLGNVFDRPFVTFFGINEGANVSMAFRFMIGYGVELNLVYDWLHAEVAAGGSWRYTFSGAPVSLQADLQYFNTGQTGGTRAGGLFAAVSGAAGPLFGRLTPVITTGFDSYFVRVSFAAGLLFVILPDVPGLSVIAEFAPPFGIGGAFHADELGGNPAISLAARLDTYGHNFLFVISNSFQLGERRFMTGVPAGAAGTGIGGSGFLNALYFGFTVRRRFDF